MSLYFLVLFYMVTEDHLQPYKPLPKFLCIKAIIFFSFWCASSSWRWRGNEATERLSTRAMRVRASRQDSGTMNSG